MCKFAGKIQLMNLLKISDDKGHDHAVINIGVLQWYRRLPTVINR